jgi:hypothetical protein
VPKTTTTTPQQIGDIGERAFEAFASRAGILTHQPNKDRNGWDNLLELNTIRAGDGRPRDLREGPLRCFVQIKTTMPGGKVRAVPLEILDKAAKDPGPWFFIHVQLDASNVAERYLVLHIDRDIVATVLQRERAATVANASLRELVSLPWSNAVEFGPNQHDRFGLWLRGTVAEPIAYSERKVDWLRHVGFEAMPIHGSFRLGSSREVGDLAEVFLGLRESVEVKELKIANVRFGIPVAEPIIPGP